MLDILDVRAKAIIDELIDFDGPERLARLVRECDGDTALRARVEALLAAMEKDDGFLRLPTLDVGAAPNECAASESPGERIGSYTLQRLIGEGGFGSVYLAEQSAPVRRLVALKIIKLGMDTRQVIARFEAERQALALMDHPNIARVFDAGATGRGRPYFVMERVQGEMITRYCDRKRLPVRSRLELFCDVCSAVQHAHQKGVIHRDIKPSNVLVGEVDGRAIAKVIDFGIAKATAGRLTDSSVFTEMHQIIGTPEYMSPEQADTSAADVDTRSDIYSLGVLLYELLTGQSPFDRARLRAASLVEIQRILREEEPRRPSLRLADATIGSGVHNWPEAARAGGPQSSAAGSSVFEIAQCRNTQPVALTRLIRGDLDWIVLKCLEKERSRRYETASALADDVVRYLSNQPVTARPPSTGYKLSKFFRRNRAAVISGAIVAVTLLVATGVSLRFAVAEARQRRSAEETLHQLEQVTDFQARQLSGIDATALGIRIRSKLIDELQEPEKTGDIAPNDAAARLAEVESMLSGTDFTGLALDALESNFFQPSQAAIDEQFADQPLVRARLLQSLASTTQKLGLLQAAIEPQAEALAIRKELLGDDHPDTLDSIAAMGHLLRTQGKLEEAAPYYHDALERRRRVLGDDHPDTLTSVNNMGGLLQAQGRLDEAEQYYREALEKRRRILGEEHRDTLTSIASVGYVLDARGQYEAAEPYYREALEKRRRVLGDDDLHTLFSINNMGAILQNLGRFKEAEPLYVEALEKRRRILGDEHPDTLQSMNNLGNLLVGQKRYDEAEPYYREALEIRRRVLGDEHAQTLNSMSGMAALYQSTGRLSEAEPLSRKVLEIRRRLLRPDHPDLLASLNNMGVVLDELGRKQEAEAHFREALASERRTLGDEHHLTFATVINLSGIVAQEGRHDEAVELLTIVEPAARKRFAGEGDFRLGYFLTSLGRSRAASGAFAAAEAELLEAAEIIDESPATPPPVRRDLYAALVELYDAWHAASPDLGMDKQAATWSAKLEPPPELPDSGS